MADRVLIVKKLGSIPFTKRPTGAMKTLIEEAKTTYDPRCEMLVAWVDGGGMIQVETITDVINGHSAMPGE
jgi:hypothetical protein